MSNKKKFTFPAPVLPTTPIFSPFFTLVLILYLRPDLVLLYLGCASNPLAEKMKNKTKNAVEGIYLSNMLLCFII
jgi:hypothetical protein